MDIGIVINVQNKNLFFSCLCVHHPGISSYILIAVNPVVFRKAFLLQNEIEIRIFYYVVVLCTIIGVNRKLENGVLLKVMW